MALATEAGLVLGIILLSRAQAGSFLLLGTGAKGFSTFLGSLLYTETGLTFPHKPFIICTAVILYLYPVMVK